MTRAANTCAMSRLLLLAAMLGLLSGCVVGTKPNLETRALRLEGAEGATLVPTLAPLRDLEWVGDHLVGIAGRELITLLPQKAGAPWAHELLHLPEDVTARPVLAVDGDRVWLVDENGRHAYRITLGDPLQSERFLLPKSLEGARFVDLEWDAPRRRLWGVERMGHRILGFSVDESARTLRLVAQFGGRGREGLHFNVPLDLAVHPAGTIWILDSLNRRLVEVDPEGPSSRVVVGGDTEEFRNLLPRPRALCVDAQGFVWVYDDARGELVGFEEKRVRQGDFRIGKEVAIPAAVGRLAAGSDGIYVGQPFSARVLKVVPAR